MSLDIKQISMAEVRLRYGRHDGRWFDDDMCRLSRRTLPDFAMRANDTVYFNGSEREEGRRVFRAWIMELSVGDVVAIGDAPYRTNDAAEYLRNTAFGEEWTANLVAHVQLIARATSVVEGVAQTGEASAATLTKLREHAVLTARAAGYRLAWSGSTSMLEWTDAGGRRRYDSPAVLASSMFFYL